MARRDTPKNPHGAASGIGRCGQCNKLTFPTHKAARAAVRRVLTTKTRPYPCPEGLGWHLGHLRPSVIAGIDDRSVYQQKRIIQL